MVPLTVPCVKDLGCKVEKKVVSLALNGPAQCCCKPAIKHICANLRLPLSPDGLAPIQDAQICAANFGSADPSSPIQITAALPGDRGINSLFSRLRCSQPQTWAEYGAVLIVCLFQSYSTF